MKSSQEKHVKRDNRVAMATKPSILDVMKQRPVVGDGGYVTALERRGYAKAGRWTPEAVIEHSEGGESGENICKGWTLKSTEKFKP